MKAALLTSVINWQPVGISFEVFLVSVICNVSKRL